MMTLDTWRVRDFDPGAGSPDLASEDGEGWTEVRVPGDLYLALVEAGRLPDPFQDDNEAACAWVGEREWWWRTRFEAPSVGEGERLRLILHGLDTYATLWLNGAPLGPSRSMFRTVVFDVGARVKPGAANELLIRFDPASASAPASDLALWPFIGDGIAQSKRNLIRKAQFGWGWDWGPHLPTVGVWRPVELKLDRRASLEAVKFTTLQISAGQASAEVRVDVEVDRFAPVKTLAAQVTLRAPDGRELASQRLALSDKTASATFDLNDPMLWWTPELGAQPLYALDVRLLDGEVELDRSEQAVGVRTIALDTSPDEAEPGTSFFRFVLNGVPIFARGACWIPASSFVGAVGEAQYRPLLEAARAANMNMIRVWGGGVYEHEAFYDLCDQLGLLVWQDFMFACAPYPEDDAAFVEDVRAEVRDQLVRLRNHPCLALWCGNNENQAIHGVVNRYAARDDPLPGALYYDQIMPALVTELDPTTPYWPGSPTGGPSDNSMRAGDVHNWTVWHGIPPVPDKDPAGGMDHSPEGVAYTRYAEDMARFVSEYGIQASPVIETLRRRLAPDQLGLDSPAFLNRIKDKPKDKVNAMLSPVTGLATSLKDYVDFTQITQAESLKFGIEHYRRRKPHCSGSLIWQYNDCWPCVSWSLLDHDGFAKASYHYVRRAYAPVLASFKALDDGDVELWITNDTLQPVHGEAVVTLADFKDGALWRETVSLAVAANASAAVWRGTAAQLASSPNHVLGVNSPSGAFPANRWFFAPIKALGLSAAPVGMEVEAMSSHELRVHLRAGTYAYFVHLLAPHGWTRFSDNYFDMAAGEARTVIVRNDAHTLRPDILQVASR